jgi:hypothetical protein
LQQLVIDRQRVLQALQLSSGKATLVAIRAGAFSAGAGSITARSSASRTEGTAPVVPCTRSLATSSSQRRTWRLATSAVNVRPEAFRLAASGTRKLPFTCPLKRSTLPLAERGHQRQQRVAAAAHDGEVGLHLPPRRRLEAHQRLGLGPLQRRHERLELADAAHVPALGDLA